MFRVESELPGALRAPLGDGFVAVAADGSREVFGADGLLVAALPGDLDEDEGIVALRVDARGTFAERLSGWVALNADGSWGSLAEDPPLPADPPDEDALRAAGLPPLPMDGAATVDGRLVAWRDDGMILLGRR